MFCNISYRYLVSIFLPTESKIYVLIRRIQVMSVSRVNCNEDLLKKGCEGLRKLSRKWWLYFRRQRFCNLSNLGYVCVSCQFSCQRNRRFTRFNTSDTGYVGGSRQLQTNGRVI